MSGATTDWQARRSRATRHAPDLTATVAREPVSDAMLTLAEAEGRRLAKAMRTRAWGFAKYVR